VREYRSFRSAAVSASGPALLTLLLALFLSACGGTSPNAIVRSATPAAVATPSNAAVTPSPTLALGLWQPGTDSQAQTEIVAQEFTKALQSEDFAQSSIWAKGTTFDMWAGDVHAVGVSAVRKLYEEEAALGSWKAGSVLVGPGVVAYEGQFLQTGFSSAALDLLAVTGGRIVHEEVFLDRPSSAKALAATHWAVPPTSADTLAETEKTAAAYIKAVDTHDIAAIQGLLSGDVFFYDTALKHEQRGLASVMNWWGTMKPVTFHSIGAASVIAGPGWAVSRWTATGTGADRPGVTVPGATVMEIRGGKVVRLALYYDSMTLPLHD
jgi:hypothetical protein